MTAALTLALAALTISAPASTPTGPDAVIARWVRGTSQERPRINVWLNRDDVYSRGDRARVYFKSDVDAYVTIVRIDTDGRVRVLFPMDPWEDNWARGGKTFEVLGRDRDEAFDVDDYPGVGYLFAIASEDPFSYDEIVRGDHWDYRSIADGRVRGDPYIAVADLADRIAREGDYDYDVAEYNVERHYDYPRFVCYDCHTYASWRYWDPYSHYCSRFRIVIYDDWYYYPYRRYRNGVIIVRPYRPGPRYVFKDYDARNDYITRVAERPRGTDDRRPVVDRDRTSVDVGGRGNVPAPVSPRRRSPEATSPGATRPNGTDRRPVSKPDGAQPSPDTGNEPRRRTDPDRTREPSGAQPAPSTGNEPRRRSEPDQTREPSTARPAPDAGSTPRRRPSGSSSGIREAGPEADRGSRSAGESPRRSSGQGETRSQGAPRGESEPRGQSQPRETQPRRESEPRREASRPPERESTRSEPKAERPRSEPRSEPRAESPPRSTGQPELKRRRPN